MIESLRLVKDFLNNHGGAKLIEITSKLRQYVQDASSKYKKQLAVEKEAAEKELRMREAKKKANAEKEQREASDCQQRKRLTALQKELKLVKEGKRVADEIIKDGTEELTKAMLKANPSRQELMSIQTKMDMGVKRKAEMDIKENDILKKMK